jgi:hypothetical protein
MSKSLSPHLAHLAGHAAGGHAPCRPSTPKVQPKCQPTHPVKQAAAHPHHAHAPGHPHKRPRHLWAVIAMSAALVLGGVVVFAIGHRSGAPAAHGGSSELLVEQMRDAAHGTVTSPHAFGGELTVDRSQGLTVVARDVPPKVCVEVGWRLVKSGLLTVNGMFSQRLSAARLSEMCNDGDAGATISWSPRE